MLYLENKRVRSLQLPRCILCFNTESKHQSKAYWLKQVRLPFECLGSKNLYDRVSWMETVLRGKVQDPIFATENVDRRCAYCHSQMNSDEGSWSTGRWMCTPLHVWFLPKCNIGPLYHYGRFRHPGTCRKIFGWKGRGRQFRIRAQISQALCKSVAMIPTFFYEIGTRNDFLHYLSLALKWRDHHGFHFSFCG